MGPKAAPGYAKKRLYFFAQFLPGWLYGFLGLSHKIVLCFRREILFSFFIFGIMLDVRQYTQVNLVNDVAAPKAPIKCRFDVVVIPGRSC